MRDSEDLLTTNGTLISENRLQHLLRTGRALPRFLQGVYPFLGRGIVELASINHDLSYEVPEGCTAEVLYARAGNSSDQFIYLALVANGKPIRYFPLAPSAHEHVPLAIVETHPAGTTLEVWIGAPKSSTGIVVVDVGIVECFLET